ncbi:hypothetical protein BO94DRAFT_116009 [Aspergillus sclerotioniger CBS 115572]|uniref:Uncharacterized protein n=1 Tax=Aspergillus sclerotioniger CBS 115572 TaxID=1450535 RepID=A0A317WF46_9EURO|nr:hypothetical protein BO94DRAFT_116009 [Aspergillus sclerotioniger CBS 115572]PWY83857.1 hypothetical protein BO94DRAFT_116009 [Aspergillus sclerotioniger CBS 115572]
MAFQLVGWYIWECLSLQLCEWVSRSICTGVSWRLATFVGVIWIMFNDRASRLQRIQGTGKFSCYSCLLPAWTRLLRRSCCLYQLQNS